MESKKGIWLKTKEDGVLLFKNVSLSLVESDKEEKKDAGSFEHNKDTVIHDFKEDQTLFPHGSKYFHTGMEVFCTITDRTEEEDGKLKGIKIKMEDMGIDNTPLDYDDKLKEILLSSMDIYVRAVLKSGSKFTIHGSYNLNVNFKENMNLIFEAVGQNFSKYKLFHNQKLLDGNSEFSKIFENGKDTYIYAFESVGKPKKWTRFPRAYEHGTWSSGGSADAIAFTPNKSITLAGFQFYVPKDESECEMNYKITIDDKVVEESETKEYKDWEDTYFKTVILENEHAVKANAKINILIKLAKNLASSSYTNTYYGTDGNDYSSVPNEHMGLFTVTYGTDCCNGTSESSGQIPSVLYYLD
mmetsp:Transcript_28084/g.24811  ORF Transcript_28084/g.24811 Transcript_28084/m.24811 type:complete len:357 (-) Transcript_28084:29-1099(-)